jgi:outer membrane lipoprotein-sorting protein
MTTGGSPGWRAALIAVAAAGVFPPPVAGADWDVEQLMRALGAVKSSRATFVERKHVEILSTPLQSRGRLVYTAPGRLEKHTLSPRRESLVLEGDVLTLESGDRTRRLRLQGQPVVGVFVESIRSTLAGDLATLSRFYEVKLEGGERQWTLTLMPRDERVRQVVSEIRIGGSRDAVTRIEFTETSGDRSVMTISKEGP